MTPQEFVKKWKNTVLSERQVAQAHFLDVCKLVGVDMPGGDGLTADGDTFIFEQPVKKESGRGRADVYYEGRFAVEYKTPDKYKDLDAAYKQLREYKDDLKNPPLLVVTDINHWEIHTNFVNTQNRPYIINHSDIDSKPEALNLLRDMFHAPQRLHPRHHTEQVTIEAAQAFQLIADNMRDWDAQPTQIAYFLTKLVFCMFAEDVRLLPTAADDNPDGIFTHIVKQSLIRPSIFKRYLQHLFAAMNDGGELMMRYIRYFNGTLFIYTHVEDLKIEALDALATAAKLNWKAIEPSIFGTLFERSLDPNKRAQLGAHYTSREDILLIVEPVLMGPLRYDWDTVQLEAEPLRKRYENAKSGRERNAAVTQLLQLRERILHRIRQISVLDPACGSGNFLYVALQLLMDLEKEVIEHDLWAGLQRATPEVHPRQMYGIEKDAIAHALASIVVWIGYIQWRTNNAYVDTIRDPILEKLKGNIVRKDAILAFDEEGNPTAPDWPAVDVIVGNPPFLGAKRMRSELGNEYVDRLRRFYKGRLPAFIDLVAYWFEFAREQIELGKAKRVGLLATNSIGMGTNLAVLRRVKDTGDIFMAWSDREWILDGAAVRVAMIGFDNGDRNAKVLDGLPVETINPDLTATVDVTSTSVLSENRSIAFIGVAQLGPFVIDRKTAFSMLNENPNSSEVIKPYKNARDIVRRNAGDFIIDFGNLNEPEISKYSAVYEHALKTVRVYRKNTKALPQTYPWWHHWRPRPELQEAKVQIARCIASPIVSKYRLFVWIDTDVIASHAVTVIARDDDYFFGVLHSKLHEVWSLRMGTWLGKGNDPRYTPTTTFETFPFPWSPGSEDRSHPAHAAISRAAAQLHEERDAWLNPGSPHPQKREGEEARETWDISPALERRMQAVACELRKKPTGAEDRLWQAIRKRQLDGRKFRRQVAIGAFVVDFYCSSERLAIEVDGPIHEQQREADRIRQELIESLGIQFVRLSNHEVEYHLESSLKKIRRAFHPHPPAPSPIKREGERIGRDGLDIVDSEVKQRSESDVKRDKGDEKPLPLDGKLLPDERGDREGQGLGVGAKDLKDRTLTNLYNALQVHRELDDIKTKPAADKFAPRLDELHRALDEAVCDAYGWEYAVLDDEEEILRRLLALNLERAVD